MKMVFIGGGAHRYLSVARSLLADKMVSDKGEICIYDLNKERAKAMVAMISKTPEICKTSCNVSNAATLDEALAGADVVCVVLMAGDPKNFIMGNVICNRHGFIGSDQLSPSGAFLALKGGPVLMNIAKRMERLCPDAWLLDFANPVAVISAAVNNHTRIRCLGVCAGYTNHLWDLSRMLGKDEEGGNFLVNCAGVNHMSFILKGSKIGKDDLYEVVKRHVNDNWRMPELSERWDEGAKINITNSVQTLVRLYRKYGHLVFSTEGDGLAHLDIEGIYNKDLKEGASCNVDDIDVELKSQRKSRIEEDQIFQSHLMRKMDESEWNTEDPKRLYLLREDQNIMVRIIRAVAGVEELRIATSFPNRNAVAGFKERTVLEYSQVLGRNGIRPAGAFEIPDVFQGLVSALATHQTLLGDAIATRDPRILFDALYSYPVRQDTSESKALWRDMLELTVDEIPSEFQKTSDYFRGI